MTPDTWTSCYSDSWRDLIVPAAFGHPAKMARGLLDRILDHASQEGWLAPGGIILDPFGGIGSTGILGAYKGRRVVCVELEERFVKLAEQNFTLHAAKWKILDCPQPVVIQGDSRELCRIVSEADVVISSPPFQGQELDYGDRPNRAAKIKDNPNFKGRSHWLKNDKTCTHYGTSPGQLGAMKPGSVDAVLSSPPYSEGLGHGGEPTRGGGRSADRNLDAMQNGYGQTPGNLGNMRPGEITAIVSSPPYEKAETGGKLPSDKYPQIGGKIFGYRQEHQGCSEGQLGNTQGPTFWESALEIVQQCYQILKPGGYAIWVVKAFVRNHKIVDFPGDWRKLCESVGFITLHEHHAMLVKETQDDTFFGAETKRTEKKSFFRRLAESKGSPRIDYETVLCTQK